MNDRILVFLCGLAAGFALKGLCDAPAHRPAEAGLRQRIRPAGRRAMRDPLRRWDIVDEQGDDSFPASDPPADY